jgi:hypothetical protein
MLEKFQKVLKWETIFMDLKIEGLKSLTVKFGRKKIKFKSKN